MSDRVRAALVRSDSLLSLLRHRLERTIPWGSPGLPTLAHVDEVIGQARAALAAATPGEPRPCDILPPSIDDQWLADVRSRGIPIVDAVNEWVERHCKPRPTPTPETVERVARVFHDEYERRAPEFGYSTRPESRLPWEALPDNHRRLMMAATSAALRAVGEGA